ncbi:MAG: hypothetical protein HZC47_00905 [Methanobacterium sp.]|uniref:hypothetical protein n=1 Tax=Methanobacterium sp. TaxID=2164 RepID=UPI003D65DFB1|nr:hypothetical protein [Methanobacterium sp.]
MRTNKGLIVGIAVIIIIIVAAGTYAFMQLSGTPALITTNNSVNYSSDNQSSSNSTDHDQGSSNNDQGSSTSSNSSKAAKSGYTNPSSHTPSNVVENIKCPMCGGKGTITRDKITGYTDYFDPQHNKSWKIPIIQKVTETCSTCHGSGYVQIEIKR